mgnify:CR=1 FL=1
MAKTLISTPLDITTSDTAVSTVDITSGITSSYPVYEFHFVNMHPETDGAKFKFQVNASGQTDFNEVITSTFWRAYHSEDDSSTSLGYYASWDQAEGTALQYLTNNVGNDDDQSTSGMLTLYAPSSITYVKHFVARNHVYASSDFSYDAHVAGYINTTAAIDEIRLQFDPGNIDAGTIKMFGVS